MASVSHLLGPALARFARVAAAHDGAGVAGCTGSLPGAAGVTRAATDRVDSAARAPDAIALRARTLARAPEPDGPIVHGFLGHGTRLVTTPQAARSIARGEHQIDVVGGVRLAYPSQNLRDIESTAPERPGQTHVVQRHVGGDLARDVARLRAQPRIRAAGGYTDLAAAQFATDVTIANPANQRALAAFLADPTRSKDALYRVDLGRSVGTSALRGDLDAGHPTLHPSRYADVVVVKDGSFPEGYRVLTSYPEATRGAEVDAFGNHL